MVLNRVRLLAFLLWALLPSAVYGQSWLDVSPAAVYHPPGAPSCFTVTVTDLASMWVDVEYYYQGNGPYYAIGWLVLDSNGQAQSCVDWSTSEGLYEFTGVRSSDHYWEYFVHVYAPLTVSAVPPPAIDGLGPTCDNWDCIWVSGGPFHPDSYVYVYSSDWSAYQTYWGPAWGYWPGMWVDGGLLGFQLTNPSLLYSFGHATVHVVVGNSDGLISVPAHVQAPPPVINAGGSDCDDGYCIWLSGSFPLGAVVDFRVPGQPDVIPNAYSDLTVTPTHLSLRLNPGVRHDFDTTGLNAWVVNPVLANWSSDIYIAPVDRAVIGSIDGIVQSGSQYYLTGWACAKTFSGSIDIYVYAGGPSGTGTFMTSATASQPSNVPPTASCSNGGTSYGLSILLSPELCQQFSGQPIFVHGISPFGLENSLIGNSGAFTVPGGPATTLSWKQDYIRDSSGAVLAIARPAPSNPNPPSAPPSLSVTSTSPTSVSLSWSASSAVDGAALIGYRIYRQSGNGASLPIGSTGLNPAIVTFSDTTVQPGQTYIYTIVAVNDAQVYSTGTSVSAVTP